jgi:hypothetical protein
MRDGEEKERLRDLDNNVPRAAMPFLKLMMVNISWPLWLEKVSNDEMLLYMTLVQLMIDRFFSTYFTFVF